MTQAKLSIPTAAILPFAAFSPKDVHEGTTSRYLCLP